MHEQGADCLVKIFLKPQRTVEPTEKDQIFISVLSVVLKNFEIPE
jgi:hypothetical protein